MTASARPRGHARAMLAAAVAVAAAGACTSPAPGGPSADRLVVARPTDAVSLDPARTADIESLEVAEQVYGRLVRFSAGRLEPEPDLATSWKVSADGTIWTFQLREGVRFHDGTPFDADAVVFSFERQILPEHPGARGRLRLDARLSQHQARALRRADARAVRDRSPVRAVPGQPGDGAGGDRVADRGAQVEARLRPPPGGHGPVPAWSSGSRATASRWSATPTTGTNARTPATSCC